MRMIKIVDGSNILTIFNFGVASNGSFSWGSGTNSNTSPVQLALAGGNNLGETNPLPNDVTNKIALIDRGAIDFGLKVLNAQLSGAIGVIIINSGTGVFDISASNSSVTVNIPAVFVSLEDGNLIKKFIIANPNAIGSIIQNDPICLLKGTPILTPTGYIPIEILKIGDSVITGDNRTVSISDINHSIHLSTNSTDPYIIPTGFMNATQPFFVSPNHGIILNQFVIPSKLLNLEQKSDLDLIEYYNLKLEDYFRDSLVVNGVVLECWDGIVQVEAVLPKNKEFMTKYLELMKKKPLVIENNGERVLEYTWFRELIV
jgi:hypothetical protein